MWYHIKNTIKAWWNESICYFKGHSYTTISNQSLRSHCKRCGIINPEDWMI